MSWVRLSRRRFFQRAAAAALLTPAIAQAQTRLRAGGWLELAQLNGTATLETLGSAPLKARLGSKLKRRGEAFETGSQSSAVLGLDDSMGQIRLSENSRLELEAIGTTVRGGRVTELRLVRGQARLSLRKWSHPESRFVMNSAAGAATVIGTEFGITVQPNGKMGVATESGSVEVSAEGESVDIEGQRQTLILLGEPPQPIRALTNSTDLLMERAELSDDTLHLVGQGDPLNLLTLEGEPISTDAIGRFDITLPISNQTVVQMQAITPLGSSRTFQIPLFPRKTDGNRVLP